MPSWISAGSGFGTGVAWAAGAARATITLEVKARGDAESAAYALDDWHLRRVAVAAERLMPRYMDGVDEGRIDAIFIVPFRWPRHLVNVWQG